MVLGDRPWILGGASGGRSGGGYIYSATLLGDFGHPFRATEESSFLGRVVRPGSGLAFGGPGWLRGTLGGRFSILGGSSGGSSGWSLGPLGDLSGQLWGLVRGDGFFS